MVDATIRKAQPSDVKLLSSIGWKTYVQTFGPHNTQANMEAYRGAFSEPKLSAEIANPESIFWLAFVGDDAVGYAKVNFGSAQTENRHENEGEVERLYADTSVHGKGVGKMLFATALQEIRNRKKTAVWLGVWEHNERAKAFYLKNGFERVGEHVFPMGDDPQIDWILRKEL
ncbi:hypothetical protein HKX48_009569 [Thoreauomyces humboldtii]|nr:hypothetical protein HKX48_009569 [Thoreauomyces humboldtii]